MTITITDWEERLSSLFQHEYKFAHLALALYMDMTDGEPNLPSRMNIRDALAHLRRVIANSQEDIIRFEHLTCAREHLRRAAIDAFYDTGEAEYKKFVKIYKHYKDHYLHVELARQQNGGQPLLAHNDIRSCLQRLKAVLEGYRRGNDGSDWTHLTVEARALILSLRDFTTQIQSASAQLS